MNFMYYTTTNGEVTGRASYFFKTNSSAIDRADDQNYRAESLGIKAHYSIGAIDAESLGIKAHYSIGAIDERGIDSKQIRG